MNNSQSQINGISLSQGPQELQKTISAQILRWGRRPTGHTGYFENLSHMSSGLLHHKLTEGQMGTDCGFVVGANDLLELAKFAFRSI